MSKLKGAEKMKSNRKQKAKVVFTKEEQDKNFQYENTQIEEKVDVSSDGFRYDYDDSK